jgi:hypothetical protein
LDSKSPVSRVIDPVTASIRESKIVMMELKVNLDFTCCHCGQPVGVTVQCTGMLLYSAPEQSLAQVHVPCPGCGQANQLSFEPNGQVKAVDAPTMLRLIPEPSMN